LSQKHRRYQPSREPATCTVVREGSALRYVYADDDTDSEQIEKHHAHGNYQGISNAIVLDSEGPMDQYSNLFGLARSAPAAGIVSVLAQVQSLTGVQVEAKESAELLAFRLDEMDRQPNSIDVAADGSVMLYFYGSQVLQGGAHRRYAVFGCSDVGLALMLTDRIDGNTSAVDVGDSEVDGAITKAVEFLAN
jgi:hypothetical protein